MDDRTVADRLQNREVVIRGIINDEADPPKVLELATFLDFTQRGQTMWPGIVTIEFGEERAEITQLITPTDIDGEHPYDFLREWEEGWTRRNLFGYIGEEPVIVLKRMRPPGDIPLEDGFDALPDLHLELLELLESAHSTLRDKLAATTEELPRYVLETICERLLGLIKRRREDRERGLESLGFGSE